MTVQTRKLWESPLLRFLLPLLAGMISVIVGWAPALPWQILLFVSFLALSVAIHFALRNHFTKRWLHVFFSLFISIAIFLVGMMRVSVDSPLTTEGPMFSAKTDTQDFLTLQQKLVHRIQESSLQDTTKAFVSAMLLGDKSGISTDTRQLFSRTGVAHVLALSGMHIGVIVMLIGWLIPKSLPKWLKRFETGLPLRNLLLICFTWAYIALVGMPISAIRAGLMLTLWQLHPYRRQQTLPLDVWALAGMILLLYNPWYLTDVGFQLSFAAVGSILFCQPFFFYTHHLPKRIQQWMWVCVSAQMGVMPLSVWYFGQIPTLFLLTNALITPLLLPVTLYVGLAFLGALFIFPPIADVLVPVLDTTVQLMIESAKLMDSLSQ